MIIETEKTFTIFISTSLLLSIVASLLFLPDNKNGEADGGGSAVILRTSGGK